MTDINTVVVVGRLTKNAEFRQVGGATKASFSLAVSRSRKVNDQWEDETSYVDIQAWGKMAQNLEGRLPKGTKVTVEGYLRQESWEQNGEKRHKLVVVANMVDAPREQNNGSW